MSQTDVDEGTIKAASLLLALGPNEAAEVLKHLSPREVQRLGLAMAKMQPQRREVIELLINEVAIYAAKASTIQGDEETIRAMLTKAFGDERASNLLSRVLAGSETAGIESLKWMDAATAADLIKNEHPQIIATILVHLEFDQAGEILKHFPDRLRNDVALRIATLDGVQPAALKELNEALTRVLSGTVQHKKTAIGGVRHAAEILNFVGASVENSVLENVREYDPDLAQKILDEMFVFENLIDVDDRGIQGLLRETQSEQLVIALKGAADDLLEKIFKNMSQRAGEMLRDDLDAKGPVRLSEVEAAQKEILKIARRLAESGELVIGGKGDELV